MPSNGFLKCRKGVPMKKEKTNITHEASLREKAEEQLKRIQALNANPLNDQIVTPVHPDTVKSEMEQSEGNRRKLVHELEVYQVELEMQNEELKLASEKAEAATEKYTAIYDYAYTGYFTLDTDGNICELNHSAAKMLGMDRSILAKGNFKKFVTMDTKSQFSDFFSSVFTSTSRQACDVRLIVKGSPAMDAHIEAIISGDDEKCLVTVVDISKRKQAEGILALKEQEYQLFTELMSVSDQQIIELKKQINDLLHRLGEKDQFQFNP